jgi:tRNA(Ile)-lysidine synthase
MRRSTARHRPSILTIDTALFKPGLRLAVGVSGGADSVALLCALAERTSELGLVLHAAHLHHGLREAEADGDLEFSRALAVELGLPFHEARVDTAFEAKANAASGKQGESIEEAARRLRYAWFRQLLAAGELDAVATAHTLDDQAETVCAKFLRGAWTEGLGGIHPVIEFPEGRILRPLLGTTRAEVEVYLYELGQGWREDSSNRHLTYTRNRIRHQLLPLLETWNPQLREHLAQMSLLARDEEAWWQAELARLAPQFLMPGLPVRGGGRTAGDGLALDVTRLAALAPALQRRLLRHATRQLGASLDFLSTETLRSLALSGKAGQKLELAQGFRAERTHRELRLSAGAVSAAGTGGSEAAPEYSSSIPGEILAPAFGLHLRIEFSTEGGGGFNARIKPAEAKRALAPDGGFSVSVREAAPSTPVRTVTLRNWKPGDRVTLRHSGGPRKVKEVLERLRITGSGRALWPVLELDNRILWMQGVDVEPEPGISVNVTPLD